MSKKSKIRRKDLKRELRDKSMQIYSDTPGMPTIQVTYRENLRWWKKIVEGELRIEVIPDGTIDIGTEVYSQTWDVTHLKTSNDRRDSDSMSQHILKYVLGKSNLIKLMTKNALTDEEYSGLESRLIDNVALVTQLEGVESGYGEMRGRMTRQALEEKQRVLMLEAKKEEDAEKKAIRDKETEIEQRRLKIREGIKEALLDIEFRARYSICCETSKGLDDYELSRDAVMHRTRTLFDKDDNLEHRPEMNGKQDPSWSRFVKEKLGEGFHNKLSNLEADLDLLYLTIEEKVQERLKGKTEEERASADMEELFYQTLVDNFTLNDVLDLFERECTVYTELNDRFQVMLDKETHDYGQVLEDIVSRLQFTGEFITAINHDVKPYRFDLSPKRAASLLEKLHKTTNPVKDILEFVTAGQDTIVSITDRASFELAVETLQADFRDYLASNHQSLRVPARDSRSISKDHYLIRIGKQHDRFVKPGSYGKVTCSYDPRRMQFTFISGDPVSTPYTATFYSWDDFRHAERIGTLYGDTTKAASQIIEEAKKKSLDKLEDKTLTADKEKIRNWHPYLSQQREFRKGFYTRMVSRMKRIFEEYGTNGAEEEITIDVVEE